MSHVRTLVPHQKKLLQADLILKHGYVPETSMQKEIEDRRSKMNMKINEKIAAINKLKCEHQTRTIVKNQLEANRQVMTDEP
jgi:hypothetical protein